MNKKIVVIGAGFAGLAIVKSLVKIDLEVLLIDKHNYHTFQPLLYQVATGGLEPSNIAYPVRRIFRGKQGFEFRMAEVVSIDAPNNTLETSIGNFSYDYLVIATGSANNYFNFEATKEKLLSLKSVNDALDIRSKLMQNIEKASAIEDETLQEELASFSIIGAGPSGIEMAGAIAEMKNRVLPRDFPHFDFSKMKIYLFEAADKVLLTMSEESSKHGLKYLKDLGVEVRLNAKVKTYDGHRLELEDGSSVSSNMVIWTAGVKGNPIKGLENQLVSGDRIAINEFNQVEGFSNIFAIGDVAACKDKEHPKGLPMLAQVAMQHGDHLANNIARLLKGKAMIPFKYNDKGTMATVGKNKAVVDLPNYSFQGVLAWFVWMLVHIAALVGFRNKLITLIDWGSNYINYDRPLGAIIRRYEREDE